MISYLYYRALSLRAERGEIGGALMPILGILLVLGSYMMFPDTFHSFFHWLMRETFTALNDSFGGGGKGATGATGPTGRGGGK